MNKEIETTRVECEDSPKNYSLSLEEFKKVAKEGVVIPVFRVLSANITPVFTYSQLLGEKTGKEESPAFTFSPSVLLESFEGGEKIGRYSYIGILPKEGIVVKSNEISEIKNGIVSTQKTDKVTDPLALIRDKVGKSIARSQGLPPFVGGYVGYLGYEVVCAFEDTVPKSNPDALKIPDAILFNFDSVVAFDHLKHELKVIGNISVENLNDLEKQYSEATSKIDQIVDRIHSPIRFENKQSEGGIMHGVAKSNFEKQDYIKAIEKIKEYILAGDVIQVVISQRWARKTEVEPFSLYKGLREVNPSPFMAYFDYGDFQIIGASPELLLKVENGEISTWPIAGTRPRGKTPEEDERLAEELKNDPKENAEHNMLLDLGRNDVGRVSAPGTVQVPRVKEIEHFSHVMHMTSEVQGRLSNKYTSLDALRSVFPAGTVSGAPKIRAMQIIDEVEKEQRGPYAGALGYIDYSGNLEMAITIRTIVFKDKTAYIQAGGGIVYDSDPEAEYEETIAKSRGSLRAIDLAEEEY